jgi:hypothetical protein
MRVCSSSSKSACSKACVQSSYAREYSSSAHALRLARISHNVAGSDGRAGPERLARESSGWRQTFWGRTLLCGHRIWLKRRRVSPFRRTATASLVIGGRDAGDFDAAVQRTGYAGAGRGCCGRHLRKFSRACVKIVW